MTSIFTYNEELPYNAQQPYDAYAPVPLAPPTSPPPTHLALPLTIGGDGSFNTWQQDTIQEVQQSVEVIVGSTQGQRTVVPSFGMPVMDFQTPNKGTYIRAINLWDNRATVTVTVKPSTTGSAHVRINVGLARGSAT